MTVLGGAPPERLSTFSDVMFTVLITTARGLGARPLSFPPLRRSF